MDKTIIFGTGGGARTAYQYLNESKDHDVIAFTADSSMIENTTYLNLPVIGFEDLEKYYSPDEYKLFVLLGFKDLNALRIQKYLEGKSKGFAFTNYISSKSDIHGSVKIGENCFILGGQTINPDVVIEDNCVLWSGNHIGDRTIISQHAWISSHVCIGGDCKIGPASFLGMNATIYHDVSIGEKNIIGAASTIDRNTKDGAVYISTPTKLAPWNSEKFSRLM